MDRPPKKPATPPAPVEEPEEIGRRQVDQRAQHSAAPDAAEAVPELPAQKPNPGSNRHRVESSDRAHVLTPEPCG